MIALDECDVRCASGRIAAGALAACAWGASGSGCVAACGVSAAGCGCTYKAVAARYFMLRSDSKAWVFAMRGLIATAGLVGAAMFCLPGLMTTTALAAESSVTELQTIDTKIGDGAKATPGTRVTVNYTGWLYDPQAEDLHGRKFDSSWDRGQPISFELGFGRVIEGWDRGIAGMRVGGERQLIIPADMAYGAQGQGQSIPPNAPLIFDVKLEEVLQ